MSIHDAMTSWDHIESSIYFLHSCGLSDEWRSESGFCSSLRAIENKLLICCALKRNEKNVE